MHEISKLHSEMQTPLKIAVDFDGTIVEHKYPEIGKEIMPLMPAIPRRNLMKIIPAGRLRPICLSMTGISVDYLPGGRSIR